MERLLTYLLGPNPPVLNVAAFLVACAAGTIAICLAIWMPGPIAAASGPISFLFVIQSITLTTVNRNRAGREEGRPDERTGLST